MRAKAYLEQIGKFQKNISRKKKEKEEIIRLKEEIKDESYMERLDALEQEVQKEMVTYAETKHRIINEIHELKNERHVDILYNHYVEKKSLIEIAVTEHYTYEYVKLLHGRALSDFNENVLKKK